jgi:hypothetical protein
MGKLSDGIKRIKQAKADLKQAIKQKGVTIINTASLNEYDEAVKKIKNSTIVKSRILWGRQNGIMKFENGKDDRVIINGLCDDSAHFDGTTSAETVTLTNLYKSKSDFIVSLRVWLDDKVVSDSPQVIFSYGVMGSRTGAPWNSVTLVVKDLQTEPYLALVYDKDVYCHEEFTDNKQSTARLRKIFLPKKEWVHLAIHYRWSTNSFVNPSDDIHPSCDVEIYKNGEWIGQRGTYEGSSFLNIITPILSLGKPYGTSLSQFINFNGNIKDIQLVTSPGSVYFSEVIPALYKGEDITEKYSAYKILQLPLQAGKDDDSLFKSKNFIYDTVAIETSSGFDSFGYPIRYRSASEAGVAFEDYSSEDL